MPNNDNTRYNVNTDTVCRFNAKTREDAKEHVTKQNREWVCQTNTATCQVRKWHAMPQKVVYITWCQGWKWQIYGYDDKYWHSI